MTEKLIKLIDKPIIDASNELDDEIDRRYRGVTSILLKDQRIKEIAQLIYPNSPSIALGVLIYLGEDPSGTIMIRNKPISNDILHELDALVEQHLDEIKEFL